MTVGNALGYNQHWQYRHTGGELLMMTASGEPSAYYPMDSNGLAVQNTPVACLCVAVARTSVCSPLGYGGCGEAKSEEVPPSIPLQLWNTYAVQIGMPVIPLPSICVVTGVGGSCIAICPPGVGTYCIGSPEGVVCLCGSGGSCTATCERGSCSTTCSPGTIPVCRCDNNGLPSCRCATDIIIVEP